MREAIYGDLIMLYRVIHFLNYCWYRIQGKKKKISFPSGRSELTTLKIFKCLSGLTVVLKLFTSKGHFPTIYTFRTSIIYTIWHWHEALIAFIKQTGTKKENILQETTPEFNSLSASTKVVLRWIPSHCAIVGNQRVDTLQKMAVKWNNAAIVSHAKRRRPLYRRNDKTNTDSSVQRSC